MLIDKPSTMPRDLLKRFCLTRAQWRDICAEFSDDRTLSYSALAERAMVSFKLVDRPSKPSIGRILKDEAMLRQVSDDRLCFSKSNLI
jgi:hypothetical protein